MYPLQAINLNMLNILGRTDIFLYLEIAKKIVLLVPLFIGAFIGIYWMLIASIGTSIIAFLLNSYYSGRDLNYTSWEQIKDVAPSYGVAIAVALSVYFLKYLPVSFGVVLPIQALVGVAVLFVLCEGTRLREYFEVKEIVLSYIKKQT